MSFPKSLIRRSSVVSAVLALVLLGLSFAPYSFLKPSADRLVADGELESFTPNLWLVVRIPLGIAGGGFLLAAAWSLLSPETFRQWLSSWPRLTRRLSGDLKRFVADLGLLRLSVVELGLLVSISGIGLLARLMLIHRPIEYDEAYTVMAFAHSPLRTLLSDYHVPNNHVFHTILVKIAVLSLGSQPWQIRMPALISSMLLIPLVFWLGRTLYSRTVGVLSAAIVAFLPHMVVKSVSARGYIVVTVLTVMAFLLACYVFRHRNLCAWSLLVVLCAAGFYAVPIMLYPFGFLGLWMLMHTSLVDRRLYTQRAWILHLVSAGLMVGLLTLLLYTPILLGPYAKDLVASNTILESQSLQSLLEGTPRLLADVVRGWSSGLAPELSAVFLLGMLPSILRSLDRRSLRAHTGAAFLLSVLVLLVIQRPKPVSRIWLWVIPFAAIWSSAGLEVLLRPFRNTRLRRTTSTVLLGALLVGLAANGIQSAHLSNDFENPAAERVAAALAPHLTSDSLVVAAYSADAYVWYYLYLEGVARPRFFNPRKERPFDEVYVIARSEAASCNNPSVLKVLQVYGPDENLLRLDRMSEIAQIDNMKICLVPSLD